MSIIKELRLNKGWSQEHLAQVSGLSYRTIQRIERGNRAGLESLNALASAFDVDVQTLREEQNMTPSTDSKTFNEADMAEALEQRDYENNIKGFRINVCCFLVIIPFLFWLNMETSPEDIWIWYPIAAWSVSFILHYIATRIQFGRFSLFNMK